MVTLGFGFKSYVGYRIRQRKQREVAKDNDFYMQLLQEALPKDESTVSSGDANSTVEQHQQDHQLSPSAQQKELAVTAAVSHQQGNSTSSNSSNGSGGGQNHHHNSSKNAQSHNKSQSNVTSTSHANGHAVVGGGGSTSSMVASNSSGNSTMNGGVNHSKHLHRKSLDKDSSGAPSGKVGSYSYHQQQQLNSIGSSSNNAKESSRSSDSSHTNGAAMSPKERKDCDSSTSQKSHFDSLSTASYQANSSNKSTQVWDDDPVDVSFD